MDIFYYLSFIVAFLIIVVRSYTVPFAHDEVATFYYFIQPGSFLPFYSHVDANGHFLNSSLSWLCYSVFGDSEFSLRLPNTLSFIVSTFAIKNIASRLKTSSSKIVLLLFFIFSFPLLNFYSLCRGYGLSVSFLLLGLHYILNYFETMKFRKLIFSFVSLQLALSATLTLLIPMVLIGGLVLIYQLKQKIFFKTSNLFLFAAYFSLLLYWAKFGFFLQEKGALYYGQGDSYWKVTFLSLIEMIFGKSILINFSILSIFAILIFALLLSFRKFKIVNFYKSGFQILFTSFLLLLLGFYLLKLLFGVNYPEDRTGLFYYVFFILSFVYFIEELLIDRLVYTLPFLFYFGPQFVSKLNFTHHAWAFYETMPKRFFHGLVDEQKKQQELITVGGHRVIELFYSYLNYRSKEKLNHILPPEKMHMNCDYYITWEKDKPFYASLYEELDQDENSDLVLLKRKEKITRKLIYQSSSAQWIVGNQEFTNLFERPDTLFASQSPILTEIEFEVISCPKPINSWFVLQVDSAGGGKNYYFRRTPLDWLKSNWNANSSFKTSIQTDNIVKSRCRLVVFLWNLGKNNLKIKIKSVKVFSLEAKGINLFSRSPD